MKKAFGYVSVEGENENEIIANLKRLQSFGKKLNKVFGSTIKIPEDVLSKLTGLKHIEKVLVLLTYTSKPLSKTECKQWTKEIQIPSGWWEGSNFSRDLNKLDDGLVENIASDSKYPKYRITPKGRSFVRGLLAINGSEMRKKAGEKHGKETI